MCLWDVEAPTFSRQSVHRLRWSCQPYAPAALYPPGRFLVLIYVRGWVDSRDIVQLEGLGQSKNPMTSSGIEPSTFWLVAQCLNQQFYRVHPLPFPPIRLAILSSRPLLYFYVCCVTCGPDVVWGRIPRPQHNGTQHSDVGRYALHRCPNVNESDCSCHRRLLREGASLLPQKWYWTHRNVYANPEVSIVQLWSYGLWHGVDL
jgi:hypothetical protein